MSDWCGGFLLHGDASIETLLHWSTDSFLKGSFESGSHFVDSSGVGAYCMMPEPEETIPVPARNSSIVAWHDGPVSMSTAVQRLLNLNKKERFETTYAETLRNEVFMERGCWAATFCTLGRQSTIILAAKNRSVYLWLVRFRGAFLLTWSTDPMHMEQTQTLLNEAHRDEFLFTRFEIVNSICVLHPTFLTGRFKRAWFKMFWTDRLAVMSYMANHVRKRIHQL